MKQLGVLVPIVTPCSKAGIPDLTGLKAVCQYVLNVGCDGIFVAGSTGRGPWFSREDRVKICFSVADQIGSDIPLFAGCIALGLPEMLENARFMADAGAQFAVSTTPGYFKYNQKEIESILLKFADSSPLPVIIYDIPIFAGSKLDTRMIERLSQHENIVGFKDSSADFHRFKQLIAILNGVSDFYLLQGKEHLLADALYAGASGMVVSLLHINPTPFIRLYHSIHSGDKVAANKIQTQITQVMDLVEESFKRRPETSTLFHILNYALKEQRICNNILLDNDGECPRWLEKQAAKAIDIFKR